MSAKMRSNFPNNVALVADIFISAIAIIAAFALRLEGDTITPYMGALYWMVFISVLVKPIVYYLFGLYRRLWAYASINELTLISTAVTVASVVFSALMLILYTTRTLNFPRAILAIDWLLSLIGIGGVRFSVRLLAEGRSASKKPNPRKARNVLIIGAGDAGALMVREMKRNRQLGLRPIGYLDDDISKQRHQIHGVPVVGRLTDLRRTLEHRQIDEVIIAIPSAGGRVVRLVTDVCRLKGTPFRTMPGLFELLGGKVSVNRLREVDITDLLRREPAQIQHQLVGEALTGKKVLVTGAGGSIGREICRQISRWNPDTLILLGHGENSIFESMLELRENFPSIPLELVIADIRDTPRIQSVFSKFHPQVVFHAAAHKHVPLMETNIEDAVTNNIIGTRNIVSAAGNTDVERLVMISTDKAVRPANVMGATKRIAEMLVLEAAHQTGHAYSVVRFGNVLGSRGSVVPLFKRQIAHGGPVTVTHPDMKRYFMTIPEAVHLVLQSAAMGHGGEVFMLNMGQQVRILDLAEDLIRLSGLEPGKDIEVVFTGIRPGEKLSEDLWGDGMEYQKTAHPEIFRAQAEEIIMPEDLDKIIEELHRLASDGEDSTILKIMNDTIPDGNIQVNPEMDMTTLV